MHFLENETVTFTGFFVIILIFFVLISYLLSLFSSWPELKMNYPHEREFEGKSYYFVSAYIGKGMLARVSYGNALIVRIGRDGFSFVPIFPFGLFSSEIYVPFDKILKIENRGFLVKRTDLILAHTDVILGFFDKTSKRLCDAINAKTGLSALI